MDHYLRGFLLLQFLKILLNLKVIGSKIVLRGAETGTQLEKGSPVVPAGQKQFAL